MVGEESVRVREVGGGSGEEAELHITVTFTPTVPHCSLATLIGETPPGRGGELGTECTHFYTQVCVSG